MADRDPDDARAWPAVKRLLAACLEEAPASRAALLARASRDDPSVRRRVEALLRASETRHDLLDGPVVAHAVEDLLAEGGGLSLEGRLVGPYRIVRAVGEGGAGIVYEAAQETPARRVALKILRPSAFSGDAVRRFRDEVEILGRLSHPGIAPIHDAGIHEEGVEGATLAVPWFAMELVDGVPLTAFAGRLGRDGRLDLFLDVCDAVQHAHQRGVIHRDLKPGNILVAGDDDGVPRVKVLDFGVARAIAKDLPSAAPRTAPGVVVGTLPYMSPEQLDGDPADLDVRSDVYSLGVLLYELLTGRLPVDVRSDSLTGAARRVAEEIPASPSRVDRSLRGDLDTIVMRALAKEPERRYATVSELAADLRRSRRHEPITARAPRPTYLLGRFVRRHRGLTAGAAAALLFLIVALATFAAGLERSRAEQRRTATERDRAAAALAFLRDMLTAASPYASGVDVAMTDVLEQAAGAIGAERPPEVEATLRRAIGETYLHLARSREGLEQLERAADLLRAEFGQASAIALEARVGHALAAFEHVGSVPADVDPELLVRRCAARFGPDHPTTLRADAVRAAAGADDDAGARLRGALERQRRALGSHHEDTLRTADLLARRLGRGEESAALLEEIAEGRARTLGPEHGRTLAARRALAVALDRLGRTAEAEAVYRDVLERIRRVFGAGHPQTTFAEEGLAEHLLRRRRLDEAESLLLDGLDAIRTADARARRWNSLAVLYGAQGRLAEAEECAARSVEAARVRHGDGSEPLRIARDNHASVLARLGRHEEALAIYADTLPAWRRALRDVPAGLIQPLNLQANCLAFMDRWAEAEPLYREAVALSRSALADGAPLAAASISGFGVCLARLGRLDEAEARLREAESIWSALGDAYDDRRAAVRRELDRITPAR